MLVDVIADLATGNAEPTGRYLVTRTTTSTYGADGLAVPGTTSTLLITACAQPVDGRTASVAADANTTTETRLLYTDCRLYPRSLEFEPDQITIDGDTWTVFRVKRWEGFGEVIYVVNATRNLTTSQPDAAGT